MSDTTTFTINIVSNASMEFYPTNTMAQFTTLLPQKIELYGGEWEVALLVEASWPAKVKNITNAAFTVSRFDAVTNRITRPQHNQSIPDGFYPTIDSIMKKLLDEIYVNQRDDDVSIDPPQSVSWQVDPVTEKLQIRFSCQRLKDQFLLLFKSDDLSSTLGITEVIRCTMDGSDGNKQASTRIAAQGTYPVDLQGGRHTMFLYCDLIQNEILGGAQTSLLRAIPLDTSTRSAICSKTFYKLQWKPINKKNFESITITLCDEGGQLMPFVSVGRTNLAVAFRRRKSFAQHSGFWAFAACVFCCSANR